VANARCKNIVLAQEVRLPRWRENGMMPNEQISIDLRVMASRRPMMLNDTGSATKKTYLYPPLDVDDFDALAGHWHRSNVAPRLEMEELHD
jgi:hypothetical protein